MAKFKVGDSVIILQDRAILHRANSYGGGVNKGMVYTVRLAHRHNFKVEGDPSLTGNGCWIRNEFAELQPANPNIVTVSSLDYMTSTTLSQEDKEIIKEYLYENS